MHLISDLTVENAVSSIFLQDSIQTGNVIHSVKVDMSGCSTTSYLKNYWWIARITHHDSLANTNT
jgi:hypothetical protein